MDNASNCFNCMMVAPLLASLRASATLNQQVLSGKPPADVLPLPAPPGLRRRAWRDAQERRSLHRASLSVEFANVGWGRPKMRTDREQEASIENYGGTMGNFRQSHKTAINSMP